MVHLYLFSYQKVLSVSVSQLLFLSDCTVPSKESSRLKFINLFFSNVGNKLNNLLPTSTYLQPITLENKKVPLLSQVVLNREVVSRKINSLQVKKSAGKYSSKVIKSGWRRSDPIFSQLIPALY